MTADVYFKQILKNIKGCPRLCAFVLQTHNGFVLSTIISRALTLHLKISDMKSRAA